VQVDINEVLACQVIDLTVKTLAFKNIYTHINMYKKYIYTHTYTNTHAVMNP